MLKKKLSSGMYLFNVQVTILLEKYKKLYFYSLILEKISNNREKISLFS